MIENLRPYPEYKDSGLPWLGEVPAHWSLIPNRGLVRRRKVLVGERHREYRLLSLTKKGIITRDLSTGKGKFSSDMGTSQEVRSGDLVFCLFDIPETPRTVGLSRYNGMITGAYTIFEPLHRRCATFFELFYLAMDDRKLLSPLYSGLRNTIPAERFLAVKTPQPPDHEQAAIARFLAWATNRLDRAIGAKRRIIALLQEQKQAIIHRAVTRGLDPAVSLKDSGIPWLGEIPEHWEITRIKSLIREIDWRTSTGEEELLSLRMHTGLVPHNAVSSIPIASEALIGFKKVSTGQLVMNRMRAAIGMFGISERPGLVSPDYAVFEQTKPLVLKYLLALFQTPGMCRAFRVESKGLGNGASGFMRLYSERFGAIRVPLPPPDEQLEIADAIKEQTSGIESIKKRVDSEITLLREYRTRLIADVVTGKLDVRELAKGLPEEAPLNPLDDESLYDGVEAEDASESDPTDTPEE